MGPSRRNVQAARYLRADVPHVAADDTFIAILADLAASSTPAAGGSRVGKTALRARIAAVTASVALVSVGAAYAVDRLGGDERAPVGPTHTVDPASPSEPDDRYEENDEDLAPHDLDEGQEQEPNGGAGQVDQDDGGLPADEVEDGNPAVPAPHGHAGQAGADQHQSDPMGSEPKGNAGPDDTPGQTPQPTADPDADPVDPHPDADPSDAAETDADPNVDRDIDAEVDNR